MPIQVITGRAGALRDRLMADLKGGLSQGVQPMYVLVPEQYTLQAEREIMAALDVSGSFDLQVMSPARLISRVFQEAGQPPLAKVDERGRVMLMHAALRESCASLHWYQNAHHRPGFALMATKQVKELKQAGYDPQKLADLAASLPGGATRAKLNDISAMWQAYDRALQSRFMDGEDELFHAIARLQDAPFLQNAQVWAYGYELISPTLARLLTALGADRPVRLLLPLPADDAPDAYAYESVRAACARLVDMAVGAGVAIERVKLPDIAAHAPQSELSHLVRQINCFPPSPWPAEPRQVRLVLRRNPMDEAMFAMATIRHMVMAGKMRYRDAAIACFDVDVWGGPIARAAELYDVPVFLESSRAADRHPLCRFLLLALRVIGGGWQREDMEDIMRTGYTPLDPDEADMMINCAQEQALKGRLWKQPLHRYGDERDAQLDPLRQRLTAPLVTFEERFTAAADTQGQLTALWNLLTDVNASETLTCQQAAFQQAGLTSAASEYAQVWNRLMNTLDQLAALMAGTRLTARDMGDMLTQSLAAVDIKPLPQSGDAVMCGSLNHLRGDGFAMLFIMGCNEMAPAQPEGLFQQREREILSEEQNVWLAPDAGDRSRLHGIDLAGALAMAGKYVIFTYSQSDSEGGALRPGMVIGRLKGIFPAIAQAEPNDDLLYNAPRAAVSRLAAELSAGELSPGGAQAITALNDMCEWQQALDGIRAASQMRSISRDVDLLTARQLYGGPSSVSVTRLEAFAACPFRHFVQYGLRPVELKPYEVNAADEGTFFHSAMEEFLRQSDTLTPQQAIDRMDQVSERLLAPMMDGPLGQDAVMLAHARRLRAVARRAARTLTDHLRDSQFEPCALEVQFNEFSPAVVLHTQLGDVPLKGRIDRIDAWKDGEDTWLRVIDYKSGHTQLNLVRLYFGLQMQLIIYMAVALAQPGARPAGAFYFKIADPLVDSPSRDGDEIERARGKELRLSGLYTDDPAALNAMSTHVQDVVSLNIRSDGTVGDTMYKLNDDGFDALIRHALAAATQLAQGILAGQTAIEPKKMTGYSACQFCQWQSLCQQDPLLGGMPAELRPALSQKEALERIRELE